MSHATLCLCRFCTDDDAVCAGCPDRCPLALLDDAGLCPRCSERAALIAADDVASPDPDAFAVVALLATHFADRLGGVMAADIARVAMGLRERALRGAL